MRLLERIRELSRDEVTLTRGQATEVRHCLLSVTQTLNGLREYVVADKMRWTTVRYMLAEAIGELDQLAKYITPESGALPPKHKRDPAISVQRFSLCCGQPVVEQRGQFFCTWCQEPVYRFRQEITLSLGTSYITQADKNARRVEP